MDVQFNSSGSKSAEKNKKPQARTPVTASEHKIQGVFSSQTMGKVGTGTTTRRTIQKTYWYCDELSNGDVETQPLNKNYVPSGPKNTVEREEFLRTFNPEPEFYVSTVFPKMKELGDTISRGEAHRSRGEHYSAQFEYGEALSVDEENVKANFGLGLTYLAREEKGKAQDIFERLVHLDAAFSEEHKHLFNDFGINLRKNRMFDQALDYYSRALELTRNDPNIHMNMARAYYEKGDLDNCVYHLKECLRLGPEIAEAKQFWEYLERKGLVENHSNSLD